MSLLEKIHNYIILFFNFFFNFCDTLTSHEDTGGMFRAKKQRDETRHAEAVREDVKTKIELPAEMINASDVEVSHILQTCLHKSFWWKSKGF